MKILCLEDEPIIADRIERLSRDILEDRIDQFTVFDAIAPALEEAESSHFDLFLLDLNLNGEDGFELLRSSTSFAAQTIIISAYKERAIDAFDHGVIDFVAKPFDRDRLRLAFDRVDGRKPPERTTRCLSFRVAGRTDFLPLEQVRYIEGADKYSEVHFRNGGSRLHDKSLSALQKILPSGFERIHKSYLVPQNDIRSLHARAGSRYFVELADGSQLPVGRSRAKALQARFR